MSITVHLLPLLLQFAGSLAVLLVAGRSVFHAGLAARGSVHVTFDVDYGVGGHAARRQLRGIGRHAGRLSTAALILQGTVAVMTSAERCPLQRVLAWC